MRWAGPATDFKKLTPVALNISLIFFYLLAIPADLVSIVAKLLPIASNLVTGRISTQVALQLTFILAIVLLVFSEFLFVVLDLSSIVPYFAPSLRSPPVAPPVVVVVSVRRRCRHDQRSG
jgi:hypothetical protein